jgi:hypothetical protein
MGARSYIPQLGRFLQTDPVPGGSANAYAYVFGDPVNSNDPGGEYTNGPSSWAIELAGQITGEEVAAYEVALRAEAERKAREAAEQAEAYAALMAKTALPELSEESNEIEFEEFDHMKRGKRAHASSLLGFTDDLWGKVSQWWEKVKKGYLLVKQTAIDPLLQNLKEQRTVCKAVGYATSAGSYFVPEGKFARALGVAVGFGTTYSC